MSMEQLALIFGDMKGAELRDLFFNGMGTHLAALHVSLIRFGTCMIGCVCVCVCVCVWWPGVSGVHQSVVWKGPTGASQVDGGTGGWPGLTHCSLLIIMRKEGGRERFQIPARCVSGSDLETC